jgi:hypothetical protein
VIDKLKELFERKQKEEPKKEVKKNTELSDIKQKILAQITKIEPKATEDGLHTMVLPKEPTDVEYSDEHHDKLKTFLHKPSMTELKDMKKSGEWKHLNKIFSGPYEQE